MTPTDKPESLLPLQPLMLEILLVLHEGKLHGYRLAKELEARLPGKPRVLPGNLYRTLKTMVTRGLVERAEDNERRRYFRITRFGRRVAAAEARRLEGVVLAARAQKLISF